MSEDEMVIAQLKDDLWLGGWDNVPEDKLRRAYSDAKAGHVKYNDNKVDNELATLLVIVSGKLQGDLVQRAMERRYSDK